MKRRADKFIDYEAEEGSEEEDDDPKRHKPEAEEKISAEVRELQRQMDEKAKQGPIGVGRMDDVMRRIEEEALQQEERAAGGRTAGKSSASNNHESRDDIFWEDPFAQFDGPQGGGASSSAKSPADNISSMQGSSFKDSTHPSVVRGASPAANLQSPSGRKPLNIRDKIPSPGHRPLGGHNFGISIDPGTVPLGMHGTQRSSPQRLGASMMSPQRGGKPGGRGGEEDEDAAETRRTGFDKSVFPSPSDPKLWCVKTFGNDIEICNMLLIKLKYKRDQDPTYMPPIYSAFATDHIKGYIYVEAHKEAELRTFLQGVRMCSAWDTRLVPAEEMQNVLTTGISRVTAKECEIKAGQFVRILQAGYYKGDIGRVCKLTGDKVAVRLRPRLDIGERIERGRPPPMHLSLEAAQRHKRVAVHPQDTGHIICGLKCFRYQDSHYTEASGHVIKEFSVSKLDLAVRPTIAEEHAYSNVLAPEEYVTSTTLSSADFMPDFAVEKSIFKTGDKVECIEGQLRGMVGHIVKILDNGHLMVDPGNAAASGGGMHTMDPRHAMKCFEIGARVKVIQGERLGSIGSVTFVDKVGGVATIASDLQKDGWPDMFQVQVNKLKQTSETASNTTKNDKVGLKQTYDHNFLPGTLVNFSGGIGLVTAVHEDQATILCEKEIATDVISNLTLREKAPRKQRKGKGKGNPPEEERKSGFMFDRNRDPIYRGTLLSLLNHTGIREAVAIHLMGQYLYAEYSGRYYCEVGNDVQRYTPPFIAKAITSGSGGPLALMDTSDPNNTPSNNKANQLALLGAHNPLELVQLKETAAILPVEPMKWKLLHEQQKSFLGTRMKILRGPYKGQICEFRQHINDKEIRVALTIKNKMIPIKKDDIKIMDEVRRQEIEDADRKASEDYEAKVNHISGARYQKQDGKNDNWKDDEEWTKDENGYWIRKDADTTNGTEKAEDAEKEEEDKRKQKMLDYSRNEALFVKLGLAWDPDFLENEKEEEKKGDEKDDDKANWDSYKKSSGGWPKDSGGWNDDWNSQGNSGSSWDNKDNNKTSWNGNSGNDNWDGNNNWNSGGNSSGDWNNNSGNSWGNSGGWDNNGNWNSGWNSNSGNSWNDNSGDNSGEKKQNWFDKVPSDVVTNSIDMNKATGWDGYDADKQQY